MRIGACNAICWLAPRPPGAGPARRPGGGDRGNGDAPPPRHSQPFQARSLREGFVEAASLAAPVRVVAAARAFAAGNGYLPGQVVDRII
jgi:hypothetical protein